MVSLIPPTGNLGAGGTEEEEELREVQQPQRAARVAGPALLGPGAEDLASEGDK